MTERRQKRGVRAKKTVTDPKDNLFINSGLKLININSPNGLESLVGFAPISANSSFLIVFERSKS